MRADQCWILLRVRGFAGSSFSWTKTTRRQGFAKSWTRRRKMMAIACEPGLHQDAAALADTAADRAARRLSHSNDWIHSHATMPLSRAAFLRGRYATCDTSFSVNSESRIRNAWLRAFCRTERIRQISTRQFAAFGNLKSFYVAPDASSMQRGDGRHSKTVNSGTGKINHDAI